MSIKNKRSILVTAALPYANGPIHLGHLLEHIQTDIWVRFQRLCGHDCLFVCADDAHGTATMLSAERANTDILVWIENIRREHERHLRDFGISYDNFYSTHSEENKQLSEMIYNRLQRKGYIGKRVVRQFYDEEKKIFLADRFIRGRCPKCDTPDQYGDNCEVCSCTYDALSLKDPRSRLSGSVPSIRESEHLFFELPQFTDFLQKWMADSNLQDEVRNKLKEWFATGLLEWDISRDAPYFGFEIPGHPDKYFYVWLDAPIGYMASLANLYQKQGKASNQPFELSELFEIFKDEWEKREVFHFIGKDIMYFHCLFWPALLKGSGFSQPSGVFAHGFLTVNGEKMSKSRGTFIAAGDYLTHLDPEYIRYYFATKLSSGLEDMDFNTKEFGERVNSDLVGKLVNIASRSARFVNNNFDNRLARETTETEKQLLCQLADEGDEIAKFYEGRHFAKAVRRILEHADSVNRYLDRTKPWDLARANPTDERVQQIATTGLLAYRTLAIYLKPILPGLASRSEQLFLETDWQWDDRRITPPSGRIAPFTALLQRVKAEDTAKLTQTQIGSEK